VVLLATLFVGYTSLAGNLPPLDDELYYWCWSKELQLSYYDHPPMTALMIRASTELFGDTLFAVRLPACVATAIVLGVIGWLTRPRSILFGTVFTPLFTLGAVIVTPDTPLLLFWALYLAWLVVVHQRLTPVDGSPPARVPWGLWVVGGVLLGCGILGKYTTGLAVPAGMLSFLLIGLGSLRRWLVGYLVHLVVGFVSASPILIHNVRHEFIPLLYQWRHAMTSGEPGLKPLAEFIGVQVLLTGTLPLVLLPWVLWRFRTFIADPRLRVCACLFGLPFGFFLLKSARGPLEGNWAMASYLAFWPLAAFWYSGLDNVRWRWRWFWKWGTRLSFLPPVLGVTALGAHLVRPFPAAVLSPNADRVTRLKDREELIAAFAATTRTLPAPLPVFTDTYQTTALLRFHGVDAHQEFGVSRPSHFTQRPERMSDHPAVYYFSNAAIESKMNDEGRVGAFADHVASFDPPILVAEFPLFVRGERCDSYMLWLYQKPFARRCPNELAVPPPVLPPHRLKGSLSSRP
jgi:hypothetical protein